MATKPDDTSTSSWQARHQILMAMSNEGRVRIAIDLSEAVREIQLEGILSRNPGWSRAQAIHQFVAKRFGVDLT